MRDTKSSYLQWVKGHQDSIKSYSALPRVAQMNIDADFLATRYRLRGKLQSSENIDHFPAQKISIAINGRRLTSQYDECIRYHINGYYLKQYMQQKWGWTEATWNDVDLDNFRRHYKSLDSTTRILQTKIVHDQLPTGETQYCRSLVKTDSLKKCPCCNSADETWKHLMTCEKNPHNSRGFSDLLRDNILQDAHPLQQMILEGLRH